MKTFIITAIYLLTAAPAFALEEVAGCKEADYVTVNARDVAVAFQGMGYNPKCLRVKIGTAVTLPASAGHPLQGIANAEGNPFVMAEPAVTNQKRTFSKAGVHGYFCVRHGRSDGAGMAGAILVVP